MNFPDMDLLDDFPDSDPAADSMDAFPDMDPVADAMALEFQASRFANPLDAAKGYQDAATAYLAAANLFRESKDQESAKSVTHAAARAHDGAVRAHEGAAGAAHMAGNSALECAHRGAARAHKAAADLALTAGHPVTRGELYRHNERVAHGVAVAYLGVAHALEGRERMGKGDEVLKARSARGSYFNVAKAAYRAAQVIHRGGANFYRRLGVMNERAWEAHQNHYRLLGVRGSQ